MSRFNPFPPIVGINGKRYKIVSGAIRYMGGSWQLISDANHTPVNIASVTTPNTYTIRVTYSFTAKTVGSLTTTPDETYVKAGINFGASVGLTYSDINVNQNTRIGGYTAFDGSNWSTGFLRGVTSLSFSGGTLTVNHAALPELYSRDVFGGSVSCRNGAYLPCLGSFADTSFEIQIRNYAGALVTTAATDMLLYFDRHFDGECHVEQIGLASSNVWIFGIFEV